jgi:hypothetical protein
MKSFESNNDPAVAGGGKRRRSSVKMLSTFLLFAYPLIARGEVIIDRNA